MTPASTAGPQIVFLGLTRADDVLLEPQGTSPSGIPIYERPFGSGFSIVVEARPGTSGRPVGQSTFNVFGCPDLQIQVTNPLGNGSFAVCDVLLPEPGGVPATNPPRFGDDQEICDRFNDLGCRFVDGAGETRARTCTDRDACVRTESGDFGCASPVATAQFCGFVAATNSFPIGDTLVTVRVRDAQGNPGPPAQIIIRVRP
jgi:hypothetical protein